jgi:sodium-dependent dicarboxylate transporter 2/3/5
MPDRQLIGLLLGPAVFLLLLMLPTPEGMSQAGMQVAAVALLMAIWWISEAIPIPATALLPIVLFPLLGVMKTQEVTLAYANHLIYLFMGGFLIAIAMEKWNLHKRIALHTIQLVGVTPKRIVLGFMLATAFLSMWISNTATAMMMVTIGIAVLKQSGASEKHLNPALFSFGTVLMLSIAYAASIGGVATLIGTPPNAILAGVVEEIYGITIGFAQWMKFALPLSIVMLVLTWLYLVSLLDKTEQAFPGGSEATIADALQQLGPMQKQERLVLIVFVGVASAWILRGLLDQQIFPLMTDASIAMLGAIVLFIIPANWQQREFLLDWNSAVKIPWDIIILFGGGFALAEGFSDSGLTLWLAEQLTALNALHVFALLLLIVLLVVFLTEVTSNTATASLLLPVVGALAVAVNVHPLATMIAVAIAASFAFMLPVATPPNAIVFASRVVTIPQMVKVGIALNVLGVILITLFVYFVLPVAFDFELKNVPQKFLTP